MELNEQQLDLSTLHGGGLGELYQIELAKVLANIQDINTPWKKTRKIVVTLSITPATNQRREGRLTYQVDSKLVPYEAREIEIYMGVEGGKAVAAESDPRQLTIDDEVAKQSGKVTDIQERRSNGDG